jgi:transposase
LSKTYGPNNTKLDINFIAPVINRSELYEFVVIPKRWIVERSFGCLDKARRLWKNCEGTLHNSLQMVVLAFISLLLRRS